MQTLKSIIQVIIGNVSTIICGVLVGFVIPKILTVGDYGMYKIFMLYANYLGILSLGIIDGIVLKYGGYDYEQLDQVKFRGYFAWYTLLTFGFSLLFVAVSAFVQNTDYRNILVALAVYLVAVNVLGYFQQISQITQRFREYSNIKLIQSMLNSAIVLVLLFISVRGGAVTYMQYTAIFILMNIALTLWYVINYKEIVFGRRKRLALCAGEVFGLAQKGFPLLVANLCSLLILSLDRQFVSLLFTKEQYATYAFAYSMLALVTVATSAISTVLYPLLKRQNTESLVVGYEYYVGAVIAFVSLGAVVFFPLAWFIRWFLPNYTESIVIFRIILPGLGFSSAISVVIQNYFKVYDKSNAFFGISVIILIVSFVANYIAWTIFKSRESISVASILTITIWFIVAHFYIQKQHEDYSILNLVYGLLQMCLFYSVTCIDNLLVSGTLYVAGSTAVTYICKRSTLKQLYLQLKANQ